MSINSGALGATIRKHRILHGFSQEELAEAVGISPTHLKHIESEHRKPSIEVLFQLVKILHISLDKLLLSTQEPSSDELTEVSSLLSSCADRELRIVRDLIRSLHANREQNP